MNDSQGPGANGEGPSEWEGTYQGYVTVLPQYYYDEDHWVEYDDVAQIAAEADFEIAALRAHLECKEREHLATKALVKQLAESLGEMTAIVQFLAPDACPESLPRARAALAAQQQHVATQEKK